MLSLRPLGMCGYRLYLTSLDMVDVMTPILLAIEERLFFGAMPFSIDPVADHEVLAPFPST